MRTALLSCMMALLFVSPLFADVPAVSYHILRKVDLQKLISDDKDIPDLTSAEVETISIAHGHFQGQCKLYFKNKDYQFRIDVKPIDNSSRLSFSLSVYSDKTKASVGGSGAIEPGKEFSAKPDWNSPLSENMYVVLFRKVNLKK